MNDDMITKTAIGSIVGIGDDVLVQRFTDPGATPTPGQSITAILTILGEALLAGMGVGAEDIYFRSLGYAGAGMTGHYVSKVVRSYQQGSLGGPPGSSATMQLAIGKA